MSKRLFAAFAALALCPAAAYAVVTVQVERGFILSPTGRDEIFTFEVFATNPDAGENERLNAFTMALEAPTFGGPRQPRFIIPPPNVPGGIIPFDLPTTHPYVFDAYPGNGPVDPAGLSDENTVFLSAALGGTGQEANLSDILSGFGKVSVLVPADVVRGAYPILLEPGFLSLGGAGAPIVAVPSAPGGFVIDPAEPTSIGLLAPLAVLALRRRRGVPRQARS